MSTPLSVEGNSLVVPGLTQGNGDLHFSLIWCDVSKGLIPGGRANPGSGVPRWCVIPTHGKISYLFFQRSIANQLQEAAHWNILDCEIMFWTALRLIKNNSRHRAKRSGEPFTSTLDRIRAGQEVKVLQIVAGQSATRQLAQLGIRAGTTLIVRRSAPMGGPVLVDSGGSMVAIGRGMARKVSVQTLE